MSDDDVRKDVLVAFEYCYLQDDWVNPLDKALAGLSVIDALRNNGQDTKCIWEIVLHLAVWNENIVNRMLSGEPSRPAEGAWPALPSVADDGAWKAAKSRLWSSLELVKSTIETAPFERLIGPPYGLPDLLCRFTHMGYHLGQITKLRECWTGKA